ncbi:glycosyl hydrolase 43 family protein [Chitinophaga eiseniae]|uniref:Glycosyl hydrolase 43 family protein n=2 Tax=Chitinophaga eiseniae TaxID=634771 RepID=A0A847SDX1_9BACT|nr:glycosyl hydrolase 43 family protein [Chitinophaga eiseniae]
MNVKIFIPSLVFTLLFFNVFGQQTEKWGDQGNGTYINPVIPADFSDLDAIRVGNDFYAISSTMQYSPGMAVLHSRDLVNWKIISHVVNDLTQISPNLNWSKMDSYGKGVWAGSIRYYKHKFWVYFGTPDDGFFMSTATNPAGPWTPLHQVWKVSGWDDCCSFCDEDGQLYFIATNFENDPKNNKKYNIHLFRMTSDGKNLLMESDRIIHQSPGSEANKLFRINGYYYHLFSEVKPEGRVLMMKRSKNIVGPWEMRQLNHVNKTSDKEPNQGGLIQLVNGKWYFFTHHGSGDWEGRAASLLPVTWLEGWPVIGEPGEDGIGSMVWNAPKPINIPNVEKGMQTNDDFHSSVLQPQWEWNYQPRNDKWSLSERKGFLRLHAYAPVNPTGGNMLLKAGNTITQRSLRTTSNEVTIKMEIKGMCNGGYAGLTHFSTSGTSCIGIKQVNNSRYFTYISHNRDSVGPAVRNNTVWLRSTWDFQGINRYFYSLDGKLFLPFGGENQLVWGSYRGDRVGIFNFNLEQECGFVDIDFFHYRYSK